MKKRSVSMMAFVSVLCILLSFSSCGRQSKYGQGFRFPLSSEPLQLDPQVATDTASIEILSATMEGLFILDDQEQVVPALAKEYTVSEDGKTYRFTLRPDAHWSDETSLTAEDFVFAWRRVVDPLTHSSHTSLFKNIQGASAIIAGKAEPDTLGVKAVDEQTLEVTLIKPDENFLQTLTKLPFVPCSEVFFQKTIGRYGMEPEYVISSGAFVVKTWSHEEYVILEKNEQYYEKEQVLPSRVRYVIKYTEDELALLEDEGLQAAPIKNGQIKKAEKKGMQVIAYEDSLCSLWMNTQEMPLSQRLVLRECLNRETIEETLQKNALKVATGLTPLATEFNGKSYREQVGEVNEKNTYSLAQCKKIAKGMDTYTLLCSDEEEEVLLAQDILQSWQKQLEVYFRLETLPKDEVKEAVSSGDYTLAICSQMPEGETVADALSVFTSKSNQNLAKVTDKEFDAFFKKAEEKNDLQTWKKAEQLVWKICPCVPLTYEARTFAVGKGVDGIKIRPFNGGGGRAIYAFKQATREE